MVNFMRTLLAVSLLLFSSSVFSQVLVINFYEPLPGKAPLTAAYMQEARGIINAAGGQASSSNDLAGLYRFNMLFENNEAYGRFVQQLNTNPAWQAFQAKIAATPSAVQVDHRRLNLRIPGPEVSSGMVSQVTVWEAPQGTMQNMLEAAAGAILRLPGPGLLPFGRGAICRGHGP